MAFDYEYDDDATWAQASKRRRYSMIAFVSTAVLTLVVGLGAVVYAFSGSGDRGSKTAAPHSPDPTKVSDASPEPAASESPTPSASPTPSPTPTPSRTRSPAPRPTRSLKPPQETKLPPPPPPRLPPSVCAPHFNGTNLPKPQVKGFLLTASQRQFSRSIPTLRIPLKLLKAIAWQESGWQSAIIACDTGVGTMQVMPATATWLNGVYDTTWDINKPSDNVMLGGQYLAWLTKYFGDQLSTYDLTSADTTLLDAVISAYNFGQNAVKLADGKDGIPNWNYVNNVKALMNNCPCSAY
jgi:hypothetical protein